MQGVGGSNPPSPIFFSLVAGCDVIESTNKFSKLGHDFTTFGFCQLSNNPTDEISLNREEFCGTYERAVIQASSLEVLGFQTDRVRVSCSMR